jgi:hypothetical protein
MSGNITLQHHSAEHRFLAPQRCGGIGQGVGHHCQGKGSKQGTENRFDEPASISREWMSIKPVQLSGNCL